MGKITSSKKREKRYQAFDSFRIDDLPIDVSYSLIMKSIERMKERRKGIISGCYDY